jgi:hypothetical protein
MTYKEHLKKLAKKYKEDGDKAQYKALKEVVKLLHKMEF